MICQKCKKEFSENELELSHDVPCYLFKGMNRNEQKSQADKYKRRYLCKKCHGEYESLLRLYLQSHAKKFGGDYFKDGLVL